MFSDLHQVQWEPVSATKTCLMFCCFYYKQWEPAFSKNFGPQLEAFKGCPWPWWGMQWTGGLKGSWYRRALGAHFAKFFDFLLSFFRVVYLAFSRHLR